MIAITGIGLTVPGANTPGELFALLLEKRVATKMVDIPGYGLAPAGVCDCDTERHRTYKENRRGTRAGALAVFAAKEAVAAAGVDGDMAVVCGVSDYGAVPTQVELHRLLENKDIGKWSPLYGPHVVCNAPAGEVAIALGATGPVRSVSTACASGATAIIDGCEMLIAGRANTVVAGGVSEAIHGYGSFAGFAAQQALAKERCRPLDIHRDGVVISEGACFVVLERLEDAKERGAKILAEITGWGEACDAEHPTTANGVGLTRAMTEAMDMAQLSGVAAVIPHATGTVAGDEIEAECIKLVFPRARMSGNKGSIGHTMGAAGAVNVAVAALAQCAGVIPQMTGCESPAVDRVASEKLLNLGPIACNALGMWGANACIVVERHE